MPIYVLFAKAEMEGLSRWWVADGHVWELDLAEAAGSECRKGVAVDPDEEVEIPNAKGETANVIIKLGASKAGYIRVLKSLKSLRLRAQTADDTSPVPIAAFECRGIEPKAWTPTGPYTAEAEGGATYTDVGFKDGEDWCEYDEKSGKSLLLGKDIAHEFKLHREK